MVLTSKIVEKLLTDLDLRLRVALALKVTEQSVRNNANRNNNNNPLTTFVALETIKAETGLTESDILTEPIKATA